MSKVQGEAESSNPKALAYGLALRRIFDKHGGSQRQVAEKIPIDASQLNRFLSGQRLAGQLVAEALVRVVRDSGADVTDADVAELHDLRRKAQEASAKRDDRLSAYQEQMRILQEEKEKFQAHADTFKGRVQDLEAANTHLADKIETLLKRVQEEQRRADREREGRGQAENTVMLAEWGAEEGQARLKELQQQHQGALEQAARAEWSAENAAGQLAEVEARAAQAEEHFRKAAVDLRRTRKQRDEATGRSARAETRAGEVSARLERASDQLTAATQYAQESEATITAQAATIDAQAAQLQQLRVEVRTLQRQVRALATGRTTKGSEAVAEPATQVSAPLLSAGDPPRTAQRDQPFPPGLKPMPSWPQSSILARDASRVPTAGAAGEGRVPGSPHDGVSSMRGTPPLRSTGRATQRRARQRGGGRAQQRREAQRQSEAQPFWKKAIRYKSRAGMLAYRVGPQFLTLQFTALLSLTAHFLWSSSFTNGDTILAACVFILFTVTASLAILLTARAMGNESWTLAALIITAYSIMSALGYDGLTLPQVSAGADALARLFIEQEMKRTSG